MPLYRMVVTTNHPSLGGVATNTWHVRATGEDLSLNGALVDLSERLNEFYSDIGPNRPSGSVTAFDGEFSGVGPDEGSYETVPGWSGGFGAGGNPMPPANAVCINWRGQSGDRSRRGRTFIGPMSVGTLEDNGTLSAAALANLRLAAVNLVEWSDGFANGAFGIWSRQESVFRDFVGSSVRDQYAVLRSRRD